MHLKETFRYKDGFSHVIETDDGEKFWYNAKFSKHREDGPAEEYNGHGTDRYYLHGREYSKEAWTFEMRKSKLKVLGI